MFNFREIELERLQIACAAIMPNSGIRIESDPNELLGRKMIYAIQSFWGQRVVDRHERWPASWWDAVKERWYPEWLLRRFPVRWNHFDFVVAKVLTEPKYQWPEELKHRLVVYEDKSRILPG